MPVTTTCLVVVLVGTPEDVHAALPGVFDLIHQNPCPVPAFGPSPWDDHDLWSTEP